MCGVRHGRAGLGLRQTSEPQTAMQKKHTKNGHPSLGQRKIYAWARDPISNKLGIGRPRVRPSTVDLFGSSFPNSLSDRGIIE